MERALRILASLGWAGSTVLLCACVTVRVPDDDALKGVRGGQDAVVLFRVLSTDLEGKPTEPFSSGMYSDNIRVALANFETGGHWTPVEQTRFLSSESRRRGWLYLIVPRGTLYLAFIPPVSTSRVKFQHARRWRVDIPGASQAVYAGTMAVDVKLDSLLFGGTYIKYFVDMRVVDESGSAQQLMDEHLPGLGAIETILMERHEGPIILTTPR